MVKAKVASEDYATESEVVRDGLRTRQARDAALKSWLRDEVVKSCDDVTADPGSVISADEIMVGLRVAYQDRLVKPRP